MKYSRIMSADARVRRTITALCGVQFLDVLGVTSAVTALPSMLAGVSAPPAATPVLATVYAMFFGGLLVLGARLGDRYGHRRVLITGCASFAIVSLVGASAQEIVQLVAARGLQGAAAAISVPSALRLLLDATPGQPARRAALAAWSATGAAAGALGLLVGGWLSDSLGWRAVFWVNVPVGLILLIAVRLGSGRPIRENSKARLDLLGAVLLIGGVMAVIVGAALLEVAAGRLVGGLLLVVGLGSAAGFLAHQRRASAPLVPRAAFGSVNLCTGSLISFVNTATTSSTGVLATLLLQQRFKISPVGAGVALVPFSLGVVAGSALSKPLGARLSARLLAAVGLAGISGGNLLLVVTYGSVMGVVAGVLLAGLGLGVASVAGTAIGTDVDESLSGTATGVLNTAAQLGTALGVAALLLLAAGLGAQGKGTAVAWGVAAALAGLTAATLAVRAQAHPSGTAPGPLGSRSDPAATALPAENRMLTCRGAAPEPTSQTTSPTPPATTPVDPRGAARRPGD
jgi:MFS family permease